MAGANRKKRLTTRRLPVESTVKSNIEDLYEAEDPEPDEDRFVYRFDNVDNYEYEMPSDFEDEEIDEDEAFTEEDMQKYAHWFGDDEQHKGDEVEWSESEEDSEGQDGFGNDDGQLSDSQDEEQGEEGRQPLLTDDDGDSWLGDSDDDVSDDDDDDERHDNLLAEVKDGSGVRRKRKEVVLTEAYPENEFNLNPHVETGAVTIEDLVSGLGDSAMKLGAARKVLEKMSKKSTPVSAPLPSNIRDRMTRKAGYSTTKKDVSKWVPLVKAHREAPTLVFTSDKDSVPRVNTTAALTSQFKPDTEMEQQVAELLEKAGAADQAAVQEAEKQLSMKSISLEEAKARRDELSKMRALLFYHEIKAKRMSKIKSKEYRKRLKKVAQKQAAKLGFVDGDDEEALKKAAEDAELRRAQERLTLKHKNTSRWARRALKRGLTVMDEGTREAIAEQLRLGQEIRKRVDVMGKPHSGGDSEGDDDSVSASDEEGEGIAVSKTKAAALDILAGADMEMPKKGVFALPFMQRAMEKKRLQAMQEAKQVLCEVEVDGGEAADNATQPSSTGRVAFGSSANKQNGGSMSKVSDWDADGTSADEDEDEMARADRLVGGRGDEDSAPSTAPVSAARSQILSDIPTHSLRVLATLGSQQDNGITRDTPQLLGSTERAHGVVTKVRNGVGIAGVSGRSEGDGDTDFIPSAKFLGAKDGYHFKKGNLGVGYYRDVVYGDQQQRAGTDGDATKLVNGTISKSKKKRLARKRAKSAAAGHDESIASLCGVDDEDEEDGGDDGDDRQGGARAVGGEDSGGDVRAQGVVNVRQAVRVTGGVNGAVDSDSEDESGGDLKPAAAAEHLNQAELIRRAFAGDDVMEDFQAEKSAALSGEVREDEVGSTMPGWGSWSNSKAYHKRLAAEKQKQERDKAARAASRKDAKLSHVMLSEKWDKKACKYGTPTVPFPFDSKDSYERSMRQPMGKDFNTDAAFRNLTRPSVVKSSGVIIQPLKFSSAMASHCRARNGSSKRGEVAVLAGGKSKRTKV